MDKRYKKTKNKYNNDTTPIPLQIHTNNNYYQSEYNSQELPLINSRYYTQNIGYLSKSTELENRLNKINYKIAINDLKSEAILNHFEQCMRNPQYYYPNNNAYSYNDPYNEQMYYYNNEQTKRWRKKMEKRLIKEKRKAKAHFNENSIPFFYSIEKNKSQEQTNPNYNNNNYEYNKQTIKQHPKQNLNINFQIPDNLKGLLDRDKVRTFNALKLIEEECNQIKSNLKRNLNNVEMQNKLNNDKLNKLQQKLIDLKQEKEQEQEQEEPNNNSEQEASHNITINTNTKSQIQLPTLRRGTELITKMVNGRKQIILGRDNRLY